MNRRTALKTVAGIVTGTQFSTSVLAENNSAQVVELIPEPHDIHQQVEPDVPVVHKFGWRTVHTEGPEVLHEAANTASYEAYFDGEKIPAPSAHWNSIQTIEDELYFLEQWVLRWSYELPSVAPGEHEFKVVVDYKEPFVSKTSDGRTQTRTGSDTLVGRYTVTEE